MNQSLSISKRDLRIAIFIAEQGAVKLETLNRYLAVHDSQIKPRALRALATKLVENRLVNKGQILTGSSILWPTSDALTLAGITLKRGEKISKPSLSNLLHNLTVAEIRLVYEANGAIWTCERKLYEKFLEHRPDGMVNYQGTQILVEIDRSRKEKDRLRKIMKLNVGSNGQVVDYWVTPELYEFVEEQRNSLSPNIRKFVRIFIIPEVAL